MGTAAVELVAVSKSFVQGHRLGLRAPIRRGTGVCPILESISFQVPRGAVTVLLGPSGVGKSTLLKLIAGLEEPTSGVIRYAPDIEPKRDIRLVFQEPNLLPWLTVEENVVLGQRFAVNRGRVAAGGVTALLARTGLRDVAHAFPSTLSGGQAQRANLARALATAPRVLLLDEPFAALDPLTRRDAQDWLRELVRELALTAVLVTHDLDEALYLGDLLILLGGQPARVSGQWWVGLHDDVGHLRREVLEGYRLANGYEGRPSWAVAGGER